MVTFIITCDVHVKILSFTFNLLPKPSPDKEMETFLDSSVVKCVKILTWLWTMIRASCDFFSPNNKENSSVSHMSEERSLTLNHFSLSWLDLAGVQRDGSDAGSRKQTCLCCLQEPPAELCVPNVRAECLLRFQLRPVMEWQR